MKLNLWSDRSDELIEDEGIERIAGALAISRSLHRGFFECWCQTPHCDDLFRSVTVPLSTTCVAAVPSMGQRGATTIVRAIACNERFSLVAIAGNCAGLLYSGLRGEIVGGLLRSSAQALD